MSNLTRVGDSPSCHFIHIDIHTNETKGCLQKPAHSRYLIKKILALAWPEPAYILYRYKYIRIRRYLRPHVHSQARLHRLFKEFTSRSDLVQISNESLSNKNNIGLKKIKFINLFWSPFPPSAQKYYPYLPQVRPSLTDC